MRKLYANVRALLVLVLRVFLSVSLIAIAIPIRFAAAEAPGVIKPQVHLGCSVVPTARWIGGAFVNTPSYFSCSGTYDSQGRPFECRWVFNDPFSSQNSAKGTNVEHTYTRVGTYSPRLEACNAECCSSMDMVVNIVPECTVRVNPGGPYYGYVGETIKFYAKKAGCYANTQIRYAWDFGDGEANTIYSDQFPYHSFSAPGVYTVKLSIFEKIRGTDGRLLGTASTTATISPPPPPNLPPIAVIGGPYRGIAGRPISFDASGSYDPEGKPVTYSWRFGDGSAMTSGAKLSHTYSSAGTYVAILVVNDGQNNSIPVTTEVVVAPDLSWLWPSINLLLE